MPELAEGHRVELQVRRRDGRNQTLALPAAAFRALETLIDCLLSGERVAALTENQ